MRAFEACGLWLEDENEGPVGPPYFEPQTSNPRIPRDPGVSFGFSLFLPMNADAISQTLRPALFEAQRGRSGNDRSCRGIRAQWAEGGHHG